MSFVHTVGSRMMARESFGDASVLGDVTMLPDVLVDVAKAYMLATSNTSPINVRPIVARFRSITRHPASDLTVYFCCVFAKQECELANAMVGVQ